MRSQRDGRLPTITVKVLSPEIFDIAQGQGVHSLETSTRNPTVTWIAHTTHHPEIW